MNGMGKTVCVQVSNVARSTRREKMLAGELYDAFDPELSFLRLFPSESLKNLRFLPCFSVAL